MTVQKYPRASVAHWYQDKYPGDRMNANTGVVHTTEGTSLPSYSSGASAPTFTIVPNLGSKTCSVYQHFDVDRSARALVNAAGGVETNTLNCVQVELAGTCDPATHKKWGTKTPHVYWPEAPDWALLEFARLVRWLSDEHGVKMQSPGIKWKAYPGSYGKSNGIRLTGQQWLNFYGWLGHCHVPENLHGDPGLFPMAKVLEMAKDKAWEQKEPAPSKTLEQRVSSLEARVKKLEDAA